MGQKSTHFVRTRDQEFLSPKPLKPTPLQIFAEVAIFCSTKAGADQVDFATGACAN